ncbi:MAG TPA: U32 family peptidase [Bacteroidales bacterium]|nr:U32 family peptidase [Bacteroidales bacterium]HNT92460.1 U32 family peptidase [Bacteroidales bacterium]HOO65681.1 U32 family peptidase [Bacteroidales bacterium]HPE21654.1 U32 family peptidase [Bacteroidales bacterium]HPQ63073.1 U32 family peptidase [Bacteroidales bacterium]
MKRSDIEIMAPAGSWESLRAAVSGGADSVYFGVEKMNMRARSSHNFTTADLAEIVDYCKNHGLKSYLTLNIVVYDGEISEMNRLLEEASQAGITAVIATDQAAILAARERGIEIHLSTQLNISNTEALKFYSQWADVAVLSRELNLQQVKMIHEAINSNNILGPGGRPLRLEMFVHGALCMAVSGKCYLSLHEYNASANRGNCYQTCRRGYTVRDRETGYELDIDNQYIMSPKDLCTIGFLDQVIDAGARVLKIEGRARPPEYVETVSRCYSEAAAAVADGTYGREKVDGWMRQLESVFNRGFWDGYYLGQRLGEWTTTYGSSATKRKIYLGKVTNYFIRPGVAEIKLETGDIKEGDELLITGPSTGLVRQTVTGLRDESGNEVVIIPRGEVCSIKTGEKVRRSDRVFRWIDASELKKE